MELCLNEMSYISWNAPSADRNILNTIRRLILFLNERNFLAHFLSAQIGIPVSKMLLLWRCVGLYFSLSGIFFVFPLISLLHSLTLNQIGRWTQQVWGSPKYEIGFNIYQNIPSFRWNGKHHKILGFSRETRMLI